MRLIGDGEPRLATSTFTRFLGSESRGGDDDDDDDDVMLNVLTCRADILRTGTV